MEETIKLELSCPVDKSFRVSQVEGMFDLPIEAKSSFSLSVDKPPTDDSWKIGLIVGSSGSGKSSIAKYLYQKNLYQGNVWNPEKAVIDSFDSHSFKEIIYAFTIVGFSSPPGWIRPYHVLSNGEKFRCELAAALLNHSPLIAFDEYTSVVDRTVAKIASAAISKAIKKERIKKQFVAITCHYDVQDWLEPDWILDMATGKLSRRSLRRPKIQLYIYKTTHEFWPIFARHHYLSSKLSNASQCYLAVYNQTPVAFCAILPMMGLKNRRRVSRIVTLPDYQGIGIGTAFLNTLGDYYTKLGQRLNITTSHPSMIASLSKSLTWKTVAVRKICSPSIQFHKLYQGAAKRAVISFEYNDLSKK